MATIIISNLGIIKLHHQIILDPIINNLMVVDRCEVVAALVVLQIKVHPLILDPRHMVVLTLGDSSVK